MSVYSNYIFIYYTNSNINYINILVTYTYYQYVY